MRHLVLLAGLYAVLVALVLPSSLFASDPPDAADPTAQTATAPESEDPAEPAAEEAAPAGEDPAAPATPDTTAPAAPPAPAPAPEAAPPAAAEPEPAPAPAAAANDRTTQAEPPELRYLDQPKRTKRVRAKAAATANVTISDFEFTPPTISISRGDTVTWTNDGPTPHSATAEDGSFDTEVFSEGQRRSVTFDEAGSFAYYCTPHPNMKGTVVVEGASVNGQSQGGNADSGSDGSSGSAGATESDGSASTTDDDTGTSDSLPATGRDAGLVALVGVLMLAAGVGLRLRGRGQE